MRSCAFALLLVGCGPGNPGTGDAGAPDAAGPPVDLGDADALVAANVACEAALAADWSARVPSVGLASAASAAAYDPIVEKLIGDFTVPGVAVAVMRDGKLVFAKGYGFSDRDAPQLAHPDDLFRIASLSKQITAAEILRLVDAGQLSLDDRPFDLLANLQPIQGRQRNPALSSITVRQLLQHTGGWNRDTNGDPMFQSPQIAAALGEQGPADCTDTIRYMLDKPLQYTPGSTTCYSNFGYCVLGRVIELAAQQGYEAAVKGALTDPLGAPRMAIGHSFEAMRADGEVRYYDFPGAGLGTSVFPQMPGPVPWPYGAFHLEAMDSHGAWIASPIDMLRFQRGVDGRSPGQRVSPAAVAATVANPLVPGCTANGGTSPASADYWYGFGWAVNKWGNWWHTGSLPGTATEVVRAENGFGWALFLNTRPDPSLSTFWSRLDGDPWQPIVANTAFLQEDLFDQYGAFSAWKSAADHATAAAGAASAKQYASRLEGRLSGGAIQYRAQWVPLHTAATAESGVGLDCTSYHARDAALAAQGYKQANLQWFLDAAGRQRFQVTWTRW